MKPKRLPDEVKIVFHPAQVQGLTDKFFRVVWTAISLNHLRDQYFSLKVYEFVHDLKQIWPIDRTEFIRFVRHSSLHNFGTIGSQYGPLDINYWLAIYDCLYYKNRDIKLIRVKK